MGYFAMQGDVKPLIAKDKSAVRYLTVNEEVAGQRIDNFLLTQLKGVPKSWIYRILRRGEVRVNKGRCKPTRRLISGDEIRIPPLRISDKAIITPTQKNASLVEYSIIYEDNQLLVINKPSGIAVHGGSGISQGIIEILRHLRPQASYLELAHRLDKATSGCLLLAKKRSALRQLQQLQLDNAIDKRYLALLAGQWQKGKMCVDVPLRKNTLQGGERIVRVDATGKRAVTHFAVKQRFAAGMLVEARLQTGRTHQIRVHAAHTGAPVLGDQKYGDASANQLMRQAGLSRLFLHAAELEFYWSEQKRNYRFTAPLPSELEQVLEKLIKS